MKFLLLFLFFSCAKTQYIFEQTTGQISLELQGKSNDKMLKNKDLPNSYKEKIKLVAKAKKYFFDYFKLESNSIYEQTTILDQDAVTYLVIHSPVNKIKAIKTCFPIAGCFPYLGFFKEKSAIEFKKEKEREGFHTYVRPVYAYSTLNHPLLPFNDNILSSFFHFNNEQLVSLIFHELVHTVVFVKDEVQFNENLAEFIAQKLATQYFNWGDQALLKKKEMRETSLRLSNEVVRLSSILKGEYKKKKNKPEFILQNFLNNIFIPSIESFCTKNKIKLKRCWPLNQQWNNARFAAMRTYSAKQNEIAKLYMKMNLPLDQFLKKLIVYENEYDNRGNFLEFVMEKDK